MTKGKGTTTKKTKDPSKHKNPKGVTKWAKEQIIRSRAHHSQEGYGRKKRKLKPKRAVSLEEPTLATRNFGLLVAIQYAKCWAKVGFVSFSVSIHIFTFTHDPCALGR